MSFYEIRFPEEISKGSSGGPTRLTQVNVLRSGYEERITPWQHPRHKYDASIGVRSLAHLDEVLQFWHAMRGKMYGFRWKDWSDFKSNNTVTNVTFTDQDIGVGDGSTTTFQLIKTYVTLTASYERNIKKPVLNTVKIGIEGVEQLSGWSVDTTTGIITFDSAPTTGEEITAGYEFDIPARFDTDELYISIEGYLAGSLSSIPIIELRL